jgi:hypothetical protein
MRLGSIQIEAYVSRRTHRMRGNTDIASIECFPSLPDCLTTLRRAADGDALLATILGEEDLASISIKILIFQSSLLSSLGASLSRFQRAFANAAPACKI